MISRHELRSIVGRDTTTMGRGDAPQREIRTMMTATLQHEPAAAQTAVAPVRRHLVNDPDGDYQNGEAVLKVFLQLMPSKRGAYAFSDMELSEWGRLFGRLTARYKRHGEGTADAQARIVETLRRLFRAGRLVRLTPDALARMIADELRPVTMTDHPIQRERAQAMQLAEAGMRQDAEHLANLARIRHGSPLCLRTLLERIGEVGLSYIVGGSIANLRAAQQRFLNAEELEARGELEARQRELKRDRIELARKHFGPDIVDWYADHRRGGGRPAPEARPVQTEAAHDEQAVLA
jgi:hypothetical protein